MNISRDIFTYNDDDESGVIFIGYSPVTQNSYFQIFRENNIMAYGPQGLISIFDFSFIPPVDRDSPSNLKKMSFIWIDNDIFVFYLPD